MEDLRHTTNGMKCLAELDCETSESATRSLASLIGINVDDLRDRLATALSIRAFEQRARRHGHDVARAALWRKVFGDLDPPVPSVVNWFHATRVLPGTNFSEGLLPLPDALPRLVASLREIGLQPAPADEGGFHRNAHEEKLRWRGSWGPFGHLVRGAALSPAQNHFFQAPEAVVDLGFDLRAFRAATVPCIVKFRARDPRDDVFTLAFYYAYLSAWYSKADWDCSTTWSGEGRTVPVEDIVRIEFLDGAELAAMDSDDDE